MISDIFQFCVVCNFLFGLFDYWNLSCTVVMYCYYRFIVGHSWVSEWSLMNECSTINSFFS